MRSTIYFCHLPAIRAIKLLVCAVLLSGCSTTTMKLAVINGAAKLGDYSAVRGINYGPLEAQYLDVYYPESLATPSRGEGLPVVVFFYGGCWGGCETFDKNSYEFVAEAFTALGYVTVLADYRLYPDVFFPQIIDDTRAVVEWVKDNIYQYGGASDSLVLAGHSAGAHLAAMLFFNEEYLRKDTRSGVRAFIGFAGPYDFLPLTKDYQRAVFGPKEKYIDGQPIAFVDGSEPPSLLLYGELDSTVKPRNMANLAARITDLGGTVITKSYSHIDHGKIVGVLSRLIREDYRVYNDIDAFLKSVMN